MLDDIYFMLSSTDNPIVKNSKCALVVSDSDKTIESNEKNLLLAGFSILLARSAEQALNLFADKKISYVFIDACLSDVPCDELVRAIRKHVGDRYIPIIILATTDDEVKLASSISSGCDEILFKPFTLMALTLRVTSLEQIRELKHLYRESINEQLLANRILSNALDERRLKLDEVELLNKSKAVFCGDLFLTARCPDGSINTLLADFTGHGLSAAIGALPVADVFSIMTVKGFELEHILESINGKLHTFLPASMFMACIILNITKDQKQVRLWNGGMPDVYIREYGSGLISNKIISSHIPLGIDELVQNNFEINVIDITPGDQIILYSDGLTEALNSDGEMFGCYEFDQCLNENTEDRSVFTALVDTFNRFCGPVSPADDVTLACIPCTNKLMEKRDVGLSEHRQNENWCWYVEYVGTSISKINPVPIVMHEIHSISEQSDSTNKLSCIMSALYDNVIADDVSAGNKSVTENSAEFSENKINNNAKDNHAAHLSIGIKKVEHRGVPALLIRMEDCARIVSHKELKVLVEKRNNHSVDLCDSKVPLVYELNKTFCNKGTGNRLDAIIYERAQTGS